MTAVATDMSGRSGVGSVTRWSTSLALVLGVHVAGVLALLYWQDPVEPALPPPAAVMIDLAPLSAAPEVPPAERPPGPEQTFSEPPPPPEPVVEPEPIPEIAPAPDPEVAVTVRPKRKPEPPKPKQEPILHREPPKREPDRTPTAEATTAPKPMDAPPAPAPAAPAPGVEASVPSNAVPTWQALLSTHLERHKRYPRAAQRRRQEGVVYVTLMIDENGRVLSFRLQQSSGIDSLDEETLALIRRADPLPPPPPELGRQEIIVPVQYNLK